MLFNNALVAQWIEHFPPKEGVAGSIPAKRATSHPVAKINGLNHPQAWSHWAGFNRVSLESLGKLHSRLR